MTEFCDLDPLNLPQWRKWAITIILSLCMKPLPLGTALLGNNADIFYSLSDISAYDFWNGSDLPRSPSKLRLQPQSQ
jgi:hypothetical protein